MSEPMSIWAILITILSVCSLGVLVLIGFISIIETDEADDEKWKLEKEYAYWKRINRARAKNGYGPKR